MKKMDFLKSGIILHRGLHGKWPENSIKAIKQGMKKGCPIEIDIHLTLDKKVIVFHDDSLYRMCGVKKKIKDCTYDEICNLNLNNSECKIPTLEEVLKTVNGIVPLIIECKYDRPYGLLEREASIYLDLYNGEFCVKSFSPFSVFWFRLHRPSYIRGLLISNKKSTFKERFVSSMFMIKLCKPDFISCNYRLYNDKRIKKFKKPVIAWTVRNNKAFFKYKNKFDSLIVEKIDF